MTPAEEWAIRQAQASKPPPQPAAPEPDDDNPGAGSDEPDDDTPVAVPQFVKDQLAELKRTAPSSLSYRRRPKPVEDLDDPDEPRPRRFDDPTLHEQPPADVKATDPDEPPGPRRTKTDDPETNDPDKPTRPRRFDNPILYEQPRSPSQTNPAIARCRHSTIRSFISNRPRRNHPEPDHRARSVPALDTPAPDVDHRGEGRVRPWNRQG